MTDFVIWNLPFYGVGQALRASAWLKYQARMLRRDGGSRCFPARWSGAVPVWSGAPLQLG